MPKKIVIGSFFLSIAGIILELWFSGYEEPVAVQYINAFLSAVNLRLPGDEITFSGPSVNYANLFFYGLMLTGTIAYTVSKKETRLIQFVWAIIFFCKSLGLLLSLSTAYITLGLVKEFSFIALYLLHFAVIGAWIFIAYKVVRYFRNVATTEIKTIIQSGEETNTIIEASRRQRFFNLLADALIMVIIFFPTTEWIIRSEFVRGLQVGEMFLARLFVYLFVVVIQTVYYMVFEAVFQCTPGKFLSATVVVNQDGTPPKIKPVFIRTLSRQVPFEALAVLFSRGWHDEWSDTYVVKEKQGIKDGWYFLIITGLLITGFGAKIGVDKYYQYQAEKKERVVFEKQREALLDGIKHLTTNHTLTLSRPYESNVYLKTEQVTASGITFTILNDNGAFEMEQHSLEEHYSAQKDSLPKITITLAQLEKAIKKEYTTGYSSESGGEYLLEDDNKYEISEISEWYTPHIELRVVDVTNTGAGQKSLEIYLGNTGSKANLINIKDNTGTTLHWGAPLPQTFSPTGAHGTATMLKADTPEIKDVNLELTFKDSLNKIQVYRITAKQDAYDNAVMEKIK